MPPIRPSFPVPRPARRASPVGGSCLDAAIADGAAVMLSTCLEADSGAPSPVEVRHER